MKLSTHVVCGFLASVAVLAATGTLPGPSPAAMMYTLSVSVMLQYIVDAVGHSYRVIRGVLVPVRNRAHSLTAMLAMAAATGLPLLVLGHETYLAYTPAIAAAMIDHWLLDAVTEAGVYAGGRRLRLLPWRIRYNSPTANTTAILLHILVLFLLLYRAP